MVSVIITAGGTSSRFEGKNKLLYEIKGKPVISYSVELFNKLEYIDEIIISSNISLISVLKDMYSGLSKIKIIEGGKTRQESVFNGLKVCNNSEYVIIHDAARPFIEEEVILNCLNNAKEVGASIVAVKTVDTIKVVNEKGIIVSTPDRKTLWNAQTPQIFKYDLIMNLHKKYFNENFTDDSLLCEKENIPVLITKGSYSNYKITTIQDVEQFNNKI